MKLHLQRELGQRNRKPWEEGISLMKYPKKEKEKKCHGPLKKPKQRQQDELAIQHRSGYILGGNRIYILDDQKDTYSLVSSCFGKVFFMHLQSLLSNQYQYSHSHKRIQKEEPTVPEKSLDASYFPLPQIFHEIGWFC